VQMRQISVASPASAVRNAGTHAAASVGVSARSAAAPVSGTGSPSTLWWPLKRISAARTDGRPPPASQVWVPPAATSSGVAPAAGLPVRCRSAAPARGVEDFQPLADRQRAVHPEPQPLGHGGELPGVDQPPVERGLPPDRIEPGAVQGRALQGIEGQRLVELSR
jgi:hypothetical protein